MDLDKATVLADRYRVVGVLGRGGMAVVYEGYDQVLDRRVAIKVLGAHLLDDDRSVDRFRREARAAAGLNHPNVVAVHDAASDGDVHFLVMELVTGTSLADRVRAEGPLGVDDALGLADRVAAALGAAHERGLVHRDVKPSNILLAGDDVKVTDFGIARAVSAEATQTAVVMGSVPYVAPEQLEGHPGADPRSDLYALGCVLFECLTGHPPFVADTSAAVLGQHLHLHAPPVSQDRPGVAPEVDALVASLLAKDVEDRPADAADLRRRIARVRAGKAPLAPAAAAATGAGGAAATPTEVIGPAGAVGVDRSAPTEVVGGAGTATNVRDGTARLEADHDDLATLPPAETGSGPGRRVLLVLLVLAALALIGWLLVRSGAFDGGPEAPVEVPSSVAPTTSAPTTDEETSAPVVPADPTSAPAPSPTVAPSPTPPPSPTPQPSPTPAPSPTPTVPAPTTAPPSPVPTTASEAIAATRALLVRGQQTGQATEKSASKLTDAVTKVADQLAGDGDDRLAKARDEVAKVREEVDKQARKGDLGPGLAQQVSRSLDDLEATLA